MPVRRWRNLCRAVPHRVQTVYQERGVRHPSDQVGLLVPMDCPEPEDRRDRVVLLVAAQGHR